MEPKAVRLFDARQEARAWRGQGRYASALGLYRAILGRFRDDERTRLDIADTLLEAGRRKEGQEVLQAAGLHLVASGRPLLAMVALHKLRASGAGGEELAATLATTYAAGSERLASMAARPVPSDPTAEFGPLPPAPGEEPDSEAAAEAALAAATDFSAHGRYPAHLHAVPFFSELDVPSFGAVVESARALEPDPGTVLAQQGERGDSFYFVAWGRLRVTSVMQGSLRELARLHENSLFGEMALLSDRPRVATVEAAESAMLIEIDRQALEAATAKAPGVKVALDRFARERLIRNLLATSPLFTPFSKDQQAELLRRFEGLEIDPEVAVIEQDRPGAGLYVVLSGELEVSARPPDGSAPVRLGALGTGDIFGEMSILGDQPTSATVRATSPTTLLFLAKDYVQRLRAAIPEVDAYFTQVAAQRSSDNRQHFGASGLPDVVIDLDDSEPVLI